MKISEGVSMVDQAMASQITARVRETLEYMARQWAEIYELKEYIRGTCGGDFEFIKINTKNLSFFLMWGGHRGDPPEKIELTYPKRDDRQFGAYLYYHYPEIKPTDIANPSQWIENQKVAFAALQEKVELLKGKKRPKILDDKKAELATLQKEIEDLEKGNDQ